MARAKPSKESKEKAITPKPTPRLTVKAKQQPNTTPKKTATPIAKAATQSKRRTLQDRRPALKELQKPVERKIVTKPIYGTENSIVTRAISETKEVIVKPVDTQRQKALTTKPLQHGGSIGRGAVAEARLQQEQAIDEARTAYTTQRREDGEAIQALERKKRELEETSHRLSLDNQGRYIRKR